MRKVGLRLWVWYLVSKKKKILSLYLGGDQARAMTYEIEVKEFSLMCAKFISSLDVQGFLLMNLANKCALWPRDE